MTAPLKAKQAYTILGISCAEFWKIVHLYKVPRLQYGPRMIRFTQDVILELREFFTVRSPADLKRIADGRHTFTWSKANAR